MILYYKYLQYNKKSYIIIMTEAFMEKYSENLDAKNYTDEELLEHINLDDPYTETELA